MTGPRDGVPRSDTPIPDPAVDEGAVCSSESFTGARHSSERGREGGHGNAQNREYGGEGGESGREPSAATINPCCRRGPLPFAFETARPMNTPDRRTRRPSSPGTKRMCRHCREPISDRADTVLLRRTDWIPENPSVVVVHRRCADDFADSHEGSWKRFERASSAGLWLLPMISGRRPPRMPDRPRRVGSS